ncbi:AEC family transporter [Motilimonas sp. KMU-193]|uniref:AEC family transporter n=1 Tax=Motilimonas sp. KMU-193 TaxID=3388668 RepID=UPI00396B4334
MAAILALFIPILLVALLSAKSLKFRTWAPAMAFRNSGNLAIPLFGYAFGANASEAAILLFVVSTCVHVLFGGLVLNPHRGLSSVIGLCKMPLFIAAVVAMTVNLASLPIYPPILQATESLGQAAIPIMLLSLGSQMTKLKLQGLTIGLQSIGLSLISGALAYLIIVQLIPLPLLQQQMMVLFCMLPPAVMNYLYAVQFDTEPDKVAAMVLFGNAAAIITLPLLLSYAFSLT